MDASLRTRAEQLANEIASQAKTADDLNGLMRQLMKDINLVFHLAADHGGRGYIDMHQAISSSLATAAKFIEPWHKIKVHVKED